MKIIFFLGVFNLNTEPPIILLHICIFAFQKIAFMKISLSWLREYIDIDLSVDQISEYLTELGLEVEGVEEVQSIAGGLKGLVIGKVVSAIPHENADKLKVTLVDVGAEELYQIVCGAPNVAPEQKVVVALPGTTIHPSQGDAFQIKKAKIRGIESSGMICAEDEVGLGSGHDGILVLDPDAEVGQAAAKYFKLESDYVFEIGLTPNRSDANSHIGVARDLGAFLQYNSISNGGLKLPETKVLTSANASKLNIDVKNSNACPRYSAVLISGIEVKSSPDWLRKRLNSIGLKSINNVVDVTNFVLHEMGHPLHAFDAGKVKDHKIVVDTVSKGSKFVTLDNQEVELSDSDLMILDAEGNGLCLAGVYGGKTSGVTDNTVDIILECAYFDPKWIRKTSMRHDLRTDAAKTFEKGTDPNACQIVLARATDLIMQLAGGEVASGVEDFYPEKIERSLIDIECDSINKLLGIKMTESEYTHMFSCLDFEIKQLNFPMMQLAVPTYKTDVTRQADVAEEVLRIFGLNKVELPQFMQVPNLAPELFTDLGLKNKISDLLHGGGYLEAMSLSFSQSKYVKDLGFPSEDELVYVNNTSNTHLDILRPSMLFSVLENLQYNQNRQQKGAKFFEFGKKYLKSGDKYEEIQQLALTMWGKKNPDHWRKEYNGKYDFFDLKSSLNNVLSALGIEKYQVSDINNDAFMFGQRWGLGPIEIISLGSVNNKLLKYFGIKDEVFVGLIHWDNIFKILKKSSQTITEVGKYPSVYRDFALVIEETTKFEEIEKIVLNSGKPFAKSCTLFDIYRDDKNVGDGKKSYAISVGFEDQTKTLTDKEIEGLTTKIREQLSKRLSAEIRN